MGGVNGGMVVGTVKLLKVSLAVCMLWVQVRNGWHHIKVINECTYI